MNRTSSIGLNGLLSGFLAKRRRTAALPFLEGRKRILDIGCGIFTWHGCLPPGSHYTGIDRDPSIIDYNKRLFPYEFRVADFEKADCDEYRRFDAIVCLAAMEHFAEPSIALSKMQTLLNPSGIIAVTTPHPRGKWIMANGARLKIFSNDKEEHEKLLKKRDLELIAETAGLNMTKYRRFLFGYNQLAIFQPKNR